MQRLCAISLLVLGCGGPTTVTPSRTGDATGEGTTGSTGADLPAVSSESTGETEVEPVPAFTGEGFVELLATPSAILIVHAAGVAIVTGADAAVKPLVEVAEPIDAADVDDAALVLAMPEALAIHELDGTPRLTVPLSRRCSGGALVGGTHWLCASEVPSGVRYRTYDVRTGALAWDSGSTVDGGALVRAVPDRRLVIDVATADSPVYGLHQVDADGRVVSLASAELEALTSGTPRFAFHGSPANAIVRRDGSRLELTAPDGGCGPRGAACFSERVALSEGQLYEDLRRSSDGSVLLLRDTYEGWYFSESSCDDRCEVLGVDGRVHVREVKTSRHLHRVAANGEVIAVAAFDTWPWGRASLGRGEFDVYAFAEP